MTSDVDLERLVKAVGDPLVAVLGPRGRGAGEVALESAVRAVLARLMEEARADPRFARKSPAEILDYCATVLQRVRQYVLEAVAENAEESRRES